MATADLLRERLQRIDGRGYRAYRDIEGTYDFGWFTLSVDHVQVDPFAPPSRLRVRVQAGIAGFPEALWQNRARRIAAEDFLTRCFAAAADRRRARARRQASPGRAGAGLPGQPSGRPGREGEDPAGEAREEAGREDVLDAPREAGLDAASEATPGTGIDIARPGQEILERTAVRICPEAVEARFVAQLPARGRTVLGSQAALLLLQDLPEIVRSSLLHANLDAARLQLWADTAERQAVLRSRLRQLGLVAFVGEGAVLPRASGSDDRPLGRGAVPFAAPPSLRVEIDLPGYGRVRGMGLREGITLIAGGGYHGKSTLLQALERGVYDHIPGDGRECVVTIPEAVKIRAEDGRRVAGVDIHPFVGPLPGGVDTRRFSTARASGSTSQAANIVEALEVGARCLLLDEDTSATNFMLRDRRMRALVRKEPITPFLDRVRALYRERGVSTVLVVGGAGDYLDVADTVVLMEEFRPLDATARAREIRARFPSENGTPGPRDAAAGICEPAAGLGQASRIPVPGSFAGARRRPGGKPAFRARGTRVLQAGRDAVDLSALEQLVSAGQVRAIAQILERLSRGWIAGPRPLADLLAEVFQRIDAGGLEILGPFPERPAGDLARPRIFEVAAAINRLPSLEIRAG